jgi:raffinose/stachyose/melibiose transport system substrate-binding protein
MKKFLVLFVLLATALTLAACGSGSGEIYLLQNKPEIDSQLKAFAELYEEEYGVTVNVVSCGGDACQLSNQLQSDIAAGETPDIFVIDGLAAYEQYDHILYDLSDEEWVEDTDVAFTFDGSVYGFPVAVEGWGLAYNADLLEEADIDPATLNNYDAYVDAFETLDGMKAELGIDSVVSMAGGASGMSWVTADHNFNSLLSAGLAYDDLSVVNALLDGDVNASRLEQYANWVELLFEYADPTVLATGDYNAQVNAFAEEKAVFIHQGNWIEPNLAEANVTFDRAYAPHGTLDAVTDGIFVSAPSWYVVNKDSENLQGALDFLTYMATTEEGHNYMVNEIGAIPAFKSVTLQPSAPLSVSVAEWMSAGKIYAWNQYYFTSDFRSNTLGPIYATFIAAVLDAEANAKQDFIDEMTTAFEGLA